MPKHKGTPRKTKFKELYPAIAEYVSGWGWIEVGRDERNRSFVRALDERGLVWEAPSKICGADKSFDAMESALHKIMTENS